ncbi:hypothetical protein ABU162_20100 [Paenibacillus thiaminolyticus]|uniref:hypothetical protein n=1 Tax=Paenibacillus thiaminolyticus TaxID=49283 RepID=UPI0035A5D382
MRRLSKNQAAEAAELIRSLDAQHHCDSSAPPWLIIASFVNPHDIVLYGALTAHLPSFRFEVEPMPDVSPPPSMREPLFTKPRCQASYRDIYPRALQPILDLPFYRKLYYQLQKNADRQMMKVFEALTRFMPERVISRYRRTLRRTRRAHHES